MREVLSFQTPQEAAEAWANRYQNVDAHIEYGAVLFRAKDGSYRFGVTRKGSKGNGKRIRANVVFPLILGLLFDWCGRGRAVGLLHTHPMTPSGGVSQHFSQEDQHLTDGTYGLHFAYVYMIPYGGTVRNMRCFQKGEPMHPNA